MAKSALSLCSVDSQDKNVVWKPVPSYPGVLASNDGRVLLPPRYAPLPNSGYRIYAPSPTRGQIKRARKNARHFYLGVFSKFYGNIKIHFAVCEAFHGQRPFENAVVIHIDEDATNNAPSNLRWGTQRENLNMPRFIEYCKSRVGENSPTVKAKRKHQFLVGA